MVAINARALEHARALDASFASSGELVGPLHCAPIVIKDVFDSEELPTSSGTLALVAMRLEVRELRALFQRCVRGAGDFPGGFPTEGVCGDFPAAAYPPADAPPAIGPPEDGSSPSGPGGAGSG